MANKRVLFWALASFPVWVYAQSPAPAQPSPSQPAVPAAAAVSPQTPGGGPKSVEPEIRVEQVVIGKDEFTRMQREILVLKKRLEETDLRMQIAAKVKDMQKLNAPPPPPDAGVVFRAMRQNVEGDRTALFVMSDGATILAREGEVLPNGMRIVSIRTDSVFLRKGSVERRVGVGGNSNQNIMPGGAGPMGGMPSGRPL